MIITIGEIVWDILDQREVLGGAPLNTAFHLAQLGQEVNCISRVGDDALGTATLVQIAKLGLAAHFIQRDPELPTGRVRVTIGPGHEPNFDIEAPAAWDNIEPKAAIKAAGSDFVLVYGTLGQRDPRSRATIRALWKGARLRCYDVNLRFPFTSPWLVLESLPTADIVKVNDTELRQLALLHSIDAADEQKTMLQLLKKYKLIALAVTRGPRGAAVVTRDGFFEHPGFPATVVDTVGAGDAFFATLLAGYLAGQSWPEALAAANRQGARVVSQPGATPHIPR